MDSMTAATIENAAKATKAIEAHVAEAIAHLRGFEGRTVNGWLVFDDVSNRRQNLRDAREAIERAQSAMTTTVWPKAADYPEEG